MNLENASTLELALVMQKFPLKKLPAKFVSVIRSSTFEEYLEAVKTIIEWSKKDNFEQMVLDWYKANGLKFERKLYTSLPSIN